MLFSDEKITLEPIDADGNEEFDEEVLHMRQLLKTKLVDMDLVSTCAQLLKIGRCRNSWRIGSIQ